MLAGSTARGYVRFDRNGALRMSDRLAVGLLTPLQLDDHASARHFLDVLIRTAPDLSPELYGNAEPLRTPFRSIDDSVVSWTPPFLWQRRAAARTDGSVWFANPGNHSAAYLTVTGRYRPAGQAVRFTQTAATALAADFAYVHLLTARETSGPESSYGSWYPIDIGVTSSDLKRGIPSLCWATVFGPPYVRLIGRDRLLSAPGFAVELLSAERVYLQLTANAEDSLQDFEGFESIRQQVRKHLGEGLFSGQSGSAASLRIPAFVL